VRTKVKVKPRPQCGRSIARDERGASAVEFAIIVSVLFMVVFGTIQFGIAYNRHQGLQAGAREGARIAAIDGTQTDVRDRVRAAQSLFTGSDVQVKIEGSDDNGATWKISICDDGGGGGSLCNKSVPPTPCQSAGLGNLVRVTATVPGASGKYAIFIPGWGNKNITYSADGVFRCERSA
jgi:membrane-associated protease RseP (regulator of RpoE activity)